MCSVRHGRWELLELFRPSEHSAVRLDAVGSWTALPPGPRDRGGHDGIVRGGWHPGIAYRRLHVPGVAVKEVIYMWRQVGEDVMDRLLGMPRAEAMPLLTPLAMHGHIVFMNIVARYNMTVTKRLARTRPGQLAVEEGSPFDGAVGAVERGDADVFPGVIVTGDRARPMVFSCTSWTLRTVCGFLSDTALGSADAVLKPFQPALWAAVVALALAVALLEKCFRSLEDTRAEQGGASWADVFMSCTGTLTGQGFLACGDWVSGRALLATLEVFFLLTQAYYSAAIVTYLLRPPASGIRGVRDLLESPYRVACHDWIHTTRVLQNSSDPLVRELYRRKVARPGGLGFLATAEAMAVLRRPRVGLVASDDVVDEAAAAMTRRETCRLQTLDVDTPLYISLGTAKDAPFKEMMHSGTILQVERGIAHRERIVWRQRQPSCDRDAGGEFAPLELVPMLPPLVLVGVAVVFSSTLCAAEHTRARPRPRHRVSKEELNVEPYEPYLFC
ncbi:Ionotropic receptor 21a [Frankliniella fusca]|uniref:Ionotropic receptor 21a n=1 Tax=Frankliniella fusca TaxID=407009 RepID=A0AAE1LJG0_9NEOP|nr:Ionotropic receptor 21a [Frankliniella fusca]